MKKLFIVLNLLILSLSCTHEREGEILMDRNGRFYELTSDNGVTPTEAYRLIEVDTTKFKVLGFKIK
jgi:hypothetical protein